MKTKRNLIYLFASALLLSTLSTACKFPDSVDNIFAGKSGTKNNPIELSLNSWTNAEIKKPMIGVGEIWFKFKATSSTQYLYFQMDTLENAIATVYDNKKGKDGDTRNISYMNGKATSQSFSVEVDKTYYVQVVANVAYGDSEGTFNISFTDIPLAPGTSVIKLTESGYRDKKITKTSDEQWFKFTATANTQYLFIDDSKVGSINVTVYDSSFTKKTQDSYYDSGYYGDWEKKQYTLKKGKTYYVKVEPTLNTTSGWYFIAINSTGEYPY